MSASFEPIELWVDITRCHQESKRAWSTLPIVEHLIFCTDEPSKAGSVRDIFTGYNLEVKRNTRQKNGGKRAKDAGRAVDKDIFKRPGVSAPKNEVKAAGVAESLLQLQLTLLDRFFQVLRNPVLRDVFKALYLPQRDQNDDAKSVDSSEHEQERVSSPTRKDNPSTPPQTPEESRLILYNAEDLGEWKIYLEPEAQADLRKSRRRDGKAFNIVTKKLRELSHGHFSPDNQKRLIGSETKTPVYEAKMTHNTRLIYQVDCTPDTESNVERQVLRVHGIYTHAQLGRNLWKYIDDRTTRRGAEYRKRFRNKPSHKGDYVVAPASFPLDPPRKGENKRR
ncbi:hypothetical protein OBBRIDRAFT_836171 [Obba rivulosa]|uniref:Uncharacterized protein n=1 Tax=Obba rivulosa TaxID=1052685 RepID=A0A8E2DN51_9APHY|nr:hypothetical protein OBBRIDRAFT_836171 [Obba rivulosa]